jgi:hypothetical protein
VGTTTLTSGLCFEPDCEVRFLVDDVNSIEDFSVPAVAGMYVVYLTFAYRTVNILKRYLPYENDM